MRAAAAWALLLAVAAAGCGGGSGSSTLAARGPKLPSLTERCGRGPGKAVPATTRWFRAPDGVLLDGASFSHGSTGIALAHESPGDLCGWVSYAGVLSRSGFRVLIFDLRGFGLSQSPAGAKAGRFTRDFEGAVDELEREGASKFFIGGASFGGAASMVAASRLGSKIAGVVSLSGEPDLGNKYGPDAELDARAAMPRLHVPLLILGSREDGYLSVEDAQALEHRAGSASKRLALFPGGYHGWDLVDLAPYRERASRVLIDFLRRG
jgi:alpha-beta hydrolase superfamily lysophospholipase